MFRELITRWAWSTQPIDGMVLFPPNHDGSTEAMAREVFHRMVARLAAIEVYYRQWVMLWAALAFSWIVGGIPIFGRGQGSAAEPLFSPLYMFLFSLVGLVVVLPWLMKGVVKQKHYVEARDVVARCFLREIPAGTPGDLRDPWRHNWLTGNGRPLSSEITEGDARSMEMQKRAMWWLASILALALALTTMMHFTFAGLLTLVIVVVKWLFDTNPAKMRLRELEAQALSEGSMYLTAGGENWAALGESARRKQIEVGIEEGKRGIPLAVIGTTTGLLSARGDNYAPTGGLGYAFSMTDLLTHTLVFGGTGSGKTSGVLRPLAYQVAEWNGTGMVVMDGKGALPGELSQLRGMRVIRPDDPGLRVSLLGQLRPEQVVNTIVEILEGKQAKGERFFIDSGTALLRRAAVLAQAAGGGFWTLTAIGRVAADAEIRYEAVKAAPEEMDDDPIFQDALAYFKYEWDPLDERTKSNVLATAMTWLSQITAHGDLLRWAQTTVEEDNAGLLEPLTGGRVGILVPSYKYGKAGAVVTALLKARIYAVLKARAENGWPAGATPVVFLIDEAQEVATDDDATMLAIGRSLGLAMVAATQTIEGVEEKLTKPVADKWLNVYGNVIALPGRSFRTDEFVTKRLGKIWSAKVERVEGLTVRDAMKSETLTGALAASRTQESMRRWIGPGMYGMGSARRGRFTNQLSRLFGSEGDSGRSQCHVGVHELVEASEVGTLLAEPNTALVVGYRARVPRRDVVRLSPVH
jgi:hypothetical protein